MQGGGGYIIGEKLRSGSAEVKAALSRQGRYATVKDNMQVKEVSIGTDDRFVLCFNPAQAERDAIIRAQLVAQLEDVITGTDTLTATERGKIEGSLASKPGLRRFLRTTPGGLLRVDKQKIRTETNLDGKYLLRSIRSPSSALYIRSTARSRGQDLRRRGHCPRGRHVGAHHVRAEAVAG